MKSNTKLKIFNDPIYGFITISTVLIFNLIQHKYFQRLRRISQMGLSYLVYPGAHHTRFHHALGCMHLMQKAIQVLRFKGVLITEEEEEALCIAILLHDIGHGPFSHALEHALVNGIDHETISLKFMKVLNAEFDNKLQLAIKIFKGSYKKQFMCQLISSQIDMDRADYLKRDSFYTGVSEGNINSERLITMLNVVNDELVVEEKGIYSVEKFLIARRFMYWQVYLHKTGLVAEQLVTKILKRAKILTLKGENLNANDALLYFLKAPITINNFSENTLLEFAKLDDFDVISAIKQWQYHSDFILSALCKMLINRDLLKVKLKDKPIKSDLVQKATQQFMKAYNVSISDAAYFVFTGKVTNQAYNANKQQIKILRHNGKLQTISKVSDNVNIKSLSNLVEKYYICYPKNYL